MFSSTRHVQNQLAYGPARLQPDGKQSDEAFHHVIHIHDEDGGCESVFIDIESEIEEKKPDTSDSVIIDISPASIVSALQYLHILEEDELLAIENQYTKTRYELDELVAKNPQLFWWYRIDYCLANSSNLLYILFQINTSNEGIVDFVNTVSPGTTVSSNVAYGIGIPTAVLDTGLYTVIFSAYKEAVKSTLEYLFSQSIREKLDEEITFAKQSPMKALMRTMPYLANQVVLYTNDLTGVMTEIIDLADKIFSLPAPLNWFVIAGILRYGKRYYEKYMDDEYLSGLDFIRNKENHPWLYQEILRGNFAIPAQIFLQGLSSIGLRAYPYFYYLSIASADALGWWPPAAFVVPVVAWYGLNALYPKTFRHYMQDKEKVDTMLQQKFQQSGRDLQIAERDLAIYVAIQNAMKSYESAITEKYGRLFLFKNDPGVTVPLFYRTAVSGYLGYELALLFSASSVALPVVSALVLAGLLGGALYKAEANRVMYKLVRQFIEEEQGLRSKEHGVETRATVCERLASFCGKVLNISGAISGAMSTLGTGSRLPSGTPAGNGLIAILAIERALNTIRFNANRVEKTMRALMVPKEGCFASSQNTLFHHRVSIRPDSPASPQQIEVVIHKP